MAPAKVTVALASLCGLLASYILLSTINIFSQKGFHTREEEPKRILVTGAAGFIGFHIAKHLKLASQDNLVIGLDNFNDYYDVQLKIDRAYVLHELGVPIVRHDLCDVDFLRRLFAEHGFSHVVHMAAQAGVRYSLENPLTYVTTNVECSLALLDVLKTHNKVKLIYASSSSVYGKESSIPFTLAQDPDRPGNMYAATKRVNELMAYHYCQSYNISGVGMRFFTVYGPWGRPDMAVFKFAESISEGREVPMFHESDERPLSRDFTYVDDVTAGVVSALDYKPHQCGENFNIGFGHPVSVPGLVEALETELRLPAKVKKLPLPPTEILQTWADVEESRIHLGFEPHTSLKQGVNQFVSWFQDYTKSRRLGTRQAESQRWFASLLDGGYKQKPFL